MKDCIFAGTFDPITKGHETVIEECLKYYRRVYVAIGVNPEKTPFFDLETRKNLIKKIYINNPLVIVDSFDGYLVDYMKKINVFTTVRGIRNATDLEYENRMKQVNLSLESRAETVFIDCKKDFMGVSSSLVRQALINGESIKGLVNSEIEKDIISYKRKN